MNSKVSVALGVGLVLGMVLSIGGYFYSRPAATVAPKNGGKLAKKDDAKTPPKDDLSKKDAELTAHAPKPPVKNLKTLIPKAIPFTLKFTPKQYPSMPALPGLQAHLNIESGGKLLLLGGRTQGLHTFYAAPKENMPKALANKFLMVVDPANGKLWTYDVTQLPPALAGPLMANNQQGWYDRATDQMYVVGGYGWDSKKNDMITFNTILRFPVATLVQAIVAADPEAKTAAIQKLIEAGSDDRFAVTGGGLHKLGNNFYLCLGNNFQGQYRVFDPGTPKSAVTFTQEYTEQIRVFTLKPKSLNILAYGPLTAGDDPSRPLYRRDGVIKGDIDPKSGTPRIAAFGGVFKPGTTAGYTNPIYIYDNNSQPTFKVDQTLVQKFSQYECPVISVYDDTHKVIYRTFFGGISHYFYAQTPLQKKAYAFVTNANRADGVPFIGDITTISQAADGTYHQYILPEPIPNVAIPKAVIDSYFVGPFKDYYTAQTNLMGSAADFIVLSGLAKKNQAYDNDVLRLSGFQPGQTVTIGYIYGSIASVFPYALIPSHGTFPGNTIFEVTLTYTPTDAYPGDAGTAAEPTGPAGR